MRNTNLTTMWNSGLTYGANFDFKTGGYLKVGNLVVVALSLNIKSDIAETSYVDAVFDLPLPIVEAALPISVTIFLAALLSSPIFKTHMKHVLVLGRMAFYILITTILKHMRARGFSFFNLEKSSLG